MKKIKDASRYGIERGSKGDTKGCRQITRCCKSMVPSCGGNEVKQVDELLADHVFVIEREVFYDAKDNGVCKDACVEQMNSIVG